MNTEFPVPKGFRIDVVLSGLVGHIGGSWTVGQDDLRGLFSTSMTL